MTECLPPAALHACLPGPSPCHPREAELPKTPVFSYLFPTLCGFGLFFFLNCPMAVPSALKPKGPQFRP